MMRAIVPGALCVCSVPKTRWPVSAAVSAVEIVSRSRISPRRITSGSWRSAARKRVAKPFASVPTSRWLTMQRLWRWRNSIGSSIVMMWSWRVRLISSITAASVVDLPEPVGPVTRTSPRGKLGRAGEGSRKAELLERLQLVRDDAEGSRERVALQEGVDAEACEPGTLCEKSSWRSSSSRFCCSVVRMPVEQLADRVRVELRGTRRAARFPAHADAGGVPAVRWRSEAPQRDGLLEQRVD